MPGGDRELDSIVATALRWEPRERYAGAQELAEDLRRWLADLPVAAVPPSLAYRTRKLLRRRRGLVASVALISLALVVGAAVALWQARRAREEAEAARRGAQRARAVTDFVVDLFSFADPDRSQGQKVTTREMLEAGSRQLESRLQDQPRIRAALLSTVGDIYRRLGLYQESEANLDAALGLAEAGDLLPEERFDAHLGRAWLALDRRQQEEAGQQIAKALEAAGDDPAARSAALRARSALHRAQAELPAAAADAREARALDEARGPEGLPDLARDVEAQANAAFGAGELEEAVAFFRQVLTLRRQAYEGDHTEIAASLQELGSCLAEMGSADEGLALLQDALAMRLRLLGEDHPDVAFTYLELGAALRGAGRLDDAEALYRKSLEVTRRRLGPDHPSTLNAENSLALLISDRGRMEEATGMLRGTLARARGALAAGDPALGDMMVNLASLERMGGKLDAAQGLLQEALQVFRRTLDENTLAVGHTHGHLGNLERDRGNLEAAEGHYRRALASNRGAVGDHHPETVSALANLGSLWREEGRFAEAEAELAEASTRAAEFLPRDHPLRIIVDSRWARTLVDAGEARRGEELAAEVLPLAVQVFGESHRRASEARIVRAEALLALGRKEEACPLFREARDALLETGRQGTLLADAERGLSRCS